MTTIEAARARMDAAKARLSAAARAALAGDPQAEEIATVALREVDAARAELRILSAPSGVNDALLDALRERFLGRRGER
ncbi:MAG TPA: hypothetical protein VN782_12240 [Usitatibacter sp.]|nr:hypothetical protein [Usitatibacter sp.]